MAVPTVITDLSTTASSNSPSGSEAIGSPGNIDNYIRALSAFIAENYANKIAKAHPLARVSLNGSNQTIASPAQTVVSFVATGGVDTHSYWNNSTFRYVPTTAGYYRCYVAVELYGTNINSFGQITLRIRKNGSATAQVIWTSLPTSTNWMVDVTDIISCNGSTDYIDFTVEYASSTGLVIDGNSARSFAVVEYAGT